MGSDFVPDAFVPARGLGSAHAQTVFASLARPTRTPPLVRERVELPDGDFVDVDWLEAAPVQPHVMILHGLEGSSKAGYVGAVIREAHRRGWGALAMNFRSCSGEPNRLLRMYHSGETTDALEALRIFRARLQGKLFGVGFSLGGNVLLRLLEETGAQCPLHAAVAVSVPFDLLACARALDTTGGLHVLYRERFMRSLRQKALGKAKAFPGKVDVERVKKARGIEAFDDAVTAPIHGYRDAADYYTRASSGPHLGDIRRPTLLINAKDDPMVPLSSVPANATENPFIRQVLTEHGGHVGFVSGSALRPRFWAEEQALRFLDEHARTPAGA